MTATKRQRDVTNVCEIAASAITRDEAEVLITAKAVELFRRALAVELPGACAAGNFEISGLNYSENSTCILCA